jgi:hypothetical protein
MMQEVGRLGGERDGNWGRVGRALNSRQKKHIWEVLEMSKGFSKSSKKHCCAEVETNQSRLAGLVQQWSYQKGGKNNDPDSNNGKVKQDTWSSNNMNTLNCYKLLRKVTHQQLNKQMTGLRMKVPT